MKVCFETFGCRLNRAEALDDEAKYLARGWVRVESHHDADLIVIRGCSVTRRAQEDCERLIHHIRTKYPLKRVLVTGCLPGADKNYKIADAGRSFSNRGKTAAESGPSVPTRTARAYLKVQDGCSGACTFCIVPKFRGKSMSVPFEDVIKRAKDFISVGYHEIVVTGCNLAQYSSNGKKFPDLLAALAELDGDVRIRFGSLEPGPIALATVDVMAAHLNICRYLHVPIQSGSDGVLAAMRRPYHVKDIEMLYRKAIDAMPNIAFCCDVIAGFPGETDIDVSATISLFRRVHFAKAHVFPYSERPGTVAATLPRSVPREVRRERAHALSRMADDERTKFAKKFVGKIVKVVIEDEKHVAGWTSEYLWCQADELIGTKRNPAHARKSIVAFKVKSVHGHILYGDPL